jgi:signal transduction histidine kinase
MMAMEMVLAVDESDIDSDSVAARISLAEAGEEFERTLVSFVGNVERLNFLVRPEMKAATQATADFWDEVVPEIRTVLETGITTTENAEARDYVRTAGLHLAELTSEMARSLGSQMETTRRRIWYFLLGAVAFNLLLVVSGYLLIRRRIVNPLRRLEQAALTFRSGHLGARVESGHNNEIGLVERAFNDMAQEIEGLVASLEERRVFAESLITHAPVGVVVHREGGLVFANPHFLSLVEAPSIEEIDVRDFTEIFPPMEHADVASDTSGPTSRELRLKVKGAGTRKVEAVTVRIEHESREAAMTILQDVTERDELAARMMQIDRVAALGTLLAGMGHEINNPLSYLANNLEFSLQHLEQLRREVGENRETGLPPEWEERCKAVVEALQESTLGSQRIRDIVSRLREFSRIDDSPRKAIRL